MVEREVGEFPSYLAMNENVSAGTQNQALNAIVFMYRRVLEQPLGEWRTVGRCLSWTRKRDSEQSLCRTPWRASPTASAQNRQTVSPPCSIQPWIIFLVVKPLAHLPFLSTTITPPRPVTLRRR